MFSRITLLAAIAALAASSSTSVNAVATSTTAAPPIVSIQEQVLEEAEPISDAIIAEEEEEELFDEASDDMYELEEKAAEEAEEASIEAAYEAEDEAAILEEEAAAETPCPSSEPIEEETEVVETPCPSPEPIEEETEVVVEETPCPSPEPIEEETEVVETPCPSPEPIEEETEVVVEETPCPSPEPIEEETEVVETPCPTEGTYHVVEETITHDDAYPETSEESVDEPCEIDMPVPEPTTPCVIDVEDPLTTDESSEPLMPEEPVQECMDHALLESETVTSLIQRVCGVENQDNSGLKCNLQDTGLYPTASNADGVYCPADFTLKAGDSLNICCAAPSEENAIAEEDEVYASNLSVKSSGSLGATETALVATGAVAGVCALAGAAIYMRRKKAQNDAAYAVSTPGDNII